MKDLAYRPNVPVGSLPTPTTALAGVVVRLITDNKAYWCDGTQWIDLTAGGGGGTTTNALTIGTGLSGSPSSTFNGSAAVTVSVAFGTTASTACVGNDSRLSDARTPTSHTHGNITNAGAIGSTSGLPIITGASGVLQAGSFGTTAGTFCQGNDARLSDTRNTTNSLIIDFDGGSTEGTDQYTFNGSAAKSLNIIAGTNITLTKAAGSVTIAASGGGASAATPTTLGTVYGLTDDNGIALLGQSTVGVHSWVTAIGSGASASATFATALGANSTASGDHATAIGPGSTCSSANTVVLGRTTDMTVVGATTSSGTKRLQVTGGIQVFSGDVTITAAAPSVPASGNVTIFGKQFGGAGGRVIPAAMGPSGMDYSLQPHLGRQGVSIWRPPGNATTVPGVWGFSAPTAGGTATARNVATTNALTRAKRLGYVSSTTAGNYGGHYSAQAQFTVGNGSGLGGFFYSCRFGVSDATLQTAARQFVGLTSSVAAPTNVSPGTLTNCIGIGKDAADTSWYIYYGGSAAQTRIALNAANFPVNLTDIIDITLWSPPNQNGVVYYHVTRIASTGTTNEESGTLGPGTAGTTLPSNTTLLAHRAWRNNNSAAAAVGIDIISIYIETDW